MTTPWSQSSQLWIKNRTVWREAMANFREEWAVMLRDVRKRMAERGWLCRSFGDPWDMLQFRRANWPAEEATVHYELRCQDESVRRGVAECSLHLEGALSDQKVVASKLRELLGPHSVALLKELSPYNGELPEEEEVIIRSHIPLEEMSSDVAAAALNKMMKAESFVDETLLLRGRNPIWVNEFSPGDHPVHPWWFERIGDQKAVDGVGRLGGWSWRINGAEPNARKDVEHEDGMYTVLIADDAKELLKNGFAYEAYALIKSGREATMTIWADGHGYDDSGQLTSISKAFHETLKIEPTDTWQLITWRIQVPEIDDVPGQVIDESAPEEAMVPFDFWGNGIWLGINVRTNDKEFLIDTFGLLEVP